MYINPLVAFIGGMIVGVIAVLVWVRLSAIGTLRIDHTSFEKDVYRFDITKDLSALDHKHLVVLKVDPDAELSQQ